RPQEAAVPALHLAGRARLRVVDRLEVEPVGRHLDDAVEARTEQLPELLGTTGAAGEAATDADDGDGFVGGTHACALPRPRLSAASVATPSRVRRSRWLTGVAARSPARAASSLNVVTRSRWRRFQRVKGTGCSEWASARRPPSVS